MIPILAVALALAPLQDDDLADMRPEARALVAAVRAHEPGVTLAEAMGVSLAKPAVLAPPATIRVWRRKVNGSTDSCRGRVNVIPFEDYVKGVLPHEWLASWDGKALDMGAVCARTFAWGWVKAGGKYTCADVNDTTASQVYTEGRDGRTDAAVNRTRGVAIVRDGSLVIAEYSAENGSPTKFGVDEPYCEGRELQGHGRGACQWGTQRWATREGKDYTWMVAHYYPGATVQGAAAPMAPAWRDEVLDLDFPAELVAGQEAMVSIELENSGASAWDAAVRLGTSGPRDRASAFAKNGVWIDATRPIAVPATAPGGRVRLSFPVVAPAVTQPTLFEERFEVVRDGAWFGDEGAVALAIRVSPRAPGVQPPGPDDDLGDPTGGCQVGGGAGNGLALLLMLFLVALRTRKSSGSRLTGPTPSGMNAKTPRPPRAW